MIMYLHPMMDKRVETSEEIEYHREMCEEMYKYLQPVITNVQQLVRRLFLMNRGVCDE